MNGIQEYSWETSKERMVMRQVKSIELSSISTQDPVCCTTESVNSILLLQFKRLWDFIFFVCHTWPVTSSSNKVNFPRSTVIENLKNRKELDWVVSSIIWMYQVSIEYTHSSYISLRAVGLSTSLYHVLLNEDRLSGICRDQAFSAAAFLDGSKGAKASLWGTATIISIARTIATCQDIGTTLSNIILLNCSFDQIVCRVIVPDLLPEKCYHYRGLFWHRYYENASWVVLEYQLENDHHQSTESPVRDTNAEVKVPRRVSRSLLVLWSILQLDTD